MSLDRPPTREEIYIAYRLFYGREPESDAVVDGHLSHYKTLEHFRTNCLTSGEFRSIFGQMPYFLHDKWVKTEIRDGLGLWVNLRDNVVSRGCLEGAWETAVTNFVLKNLSKGDSFIDIGANIGWFTVVAADHFRKLGGGTVYAFEPRSDIFQMLSKSVAENGLGSYVRLYNAALADHAGTMELAWFVNNENAAASALAIDGAPEGAKSETVQLLRLDDLDIPGPIRLIKSDAEGAEGIVFSGAKHLLSTWRPKIAAELNLAMLPQVSQITADEFLQQMFALGYTCTLLEEDGTLEKPITSGNQTGDPAANIVFS